MENDAQGIKGSFDLRHVHDNLLNIYLEDMLKYANISKDDVNSLIFWSRGDEYFFNETIQEFELEDIELFTWWIVIRELVESVGYDYDYDYNCGANCYYEVEHGRNKQLQSSYCAQMVEKFMELIGSYSFVRTKEDFHNATKPKVLDMFKRIQTAFSYLVKNSDWIDEQTKRLILQKSNVMSVNLGFPEWLLDEIELDKYYGELEFNEKSLLMNTIKVRTFEMNKKLKSFKTAENEVKWNMAPTIVNAQNDIYRNTISKTW